MISQTTFDGISDRGLLTSLQAGLPSLARKDQDFAMSLAASITERLNNGAIATDKQRYWLETLNQRASGQAAPERATSVIGDLQGLNQLFGKAAQHLKAPAIVIGLAGQEIRISRASSEAKVPGSLNVATNAPFGESVWFGRILDSGLFEASPRAETPAGLIAGLQAFAADPAKMAAQHGKLAGKCCFCNRPLTDARSASVGYGKKCANNFGLAWGERVAVADLFSEIA